MTAAVRSHLAAAGWLRHQGAAGWLRHQGAGANSPVAEEGYPAGRPPLVRAERQVLLL